jgi:hypothetical protein
LSKEIILGTDDSNWDHANIELALLTLRRYGAPILAHFLLDFSKQLDVGILKLFERIVAIFSNSFQPENHGIYAVSWQREIDNNTYRSNCSNISKSCLKHIGKNSATTELIRLYSYFLLISLFCAEFEV